MRVIKGSVDFYRLYGNILLLSAFIAISCQLSATPKVAVKIAEYPKGLMFMCPQGGVWNFGDKTGTIGTKDKCQVSGILNEKAQKRFHVMVESVPMRESDKVSQAIEKWKASGRPVHTHQVGKQSFGPDGKTVVYDGRVVYIGVGVFLEQTPAQNLVDELAAQTLSSWIFEEIIKPAEGLLTVSLNGQVIAEGKSRFRLEPRETLKLLKVEFAKGYSWHGFADRTFRGPLIIRWGAQDALDCILETDLESILAGVVPSEISSKAGVEAIRAQSVAARGEILSKMGLRHIGEGFDFCSEQHCQVYAGETSETLSMAELMAPTQGLVLESPDGGIVDAVYSANCGGHGEANHLVWTSPPDTQLCGVWDTPKPLNLDLSKEADTTDFIRNPPRCYCQDPTVEGGDKFRWRKSISGKEWKEVEKNAGVGRIKDVNGFARGVSGRLYRLTIVGEQGSKTLMKELNIRKLFGGLRSACFIAAWKRDASGFIIGAQIEGAGWGHGVGMCQTGAQSMAKLGMAFEPILLHYFPGSRLSKFY